LLLLLDDDSGTRTLTTEFNLHVLVGLSLDLFFGVMLTPFVMLLLIVLDGLNDLLLTRILILLLIGLFLVKCGKNLRWWNFDYLVEEFIISFSFISTLILTLLLFQELFINKDHFLTGRYRCGRLLLLKQLVFVFHVAW
jgi:hypothetical protein